MFDTTASAATLTIHDQEPVLVHDAERTVRVAPASRRRAALGGNYVAAFGRRQSGVHSPVSRPASGHGYTARFDGAVHRNSPAPVDSYVFGPGAVTAAATAAPASRGSYTDANL